MPQSPAAPPALLTPAALIARMIEVATKAGAIIGDPENRALFRLRIGAFFPPPDVQRMASHTPVHRQHKECPAPGDPALPLGFGFGSVREVFEARRQLMDLWSTTPVTEDMGRSTYYVTWSCTLPIPHPFRGEGGSPGGRNVILAFQPNMPHIMSGNEPAGFKLGRLTKLVSKLAETHGGSIVPQGGQLAHKLFYVHVHFLRFNGHALFEFQTAEQAQAFEDTFTRPWASMWTGFWEKRRLFTVGFGAHIFDGNGNQIWGLYSKRMRNIPNGLV